MVEFLNGIGTALVLKATASTGGTDLLTYIVSINHIFKLLH